MLKIVNSNDMRKTDEQRIGIILKHCWRKITENCFFHVVHSTSFTNFNLWQEHIGVGQTIFSLKLCTVLAIILMIYLGVWMLIAPVSVFIIYSTYFHGIIICSQYSYCSATNAKMLLLTLLLSDQHNSSAKEIR